MSKTLLITGSTDGIGLAAAEKFVKLGYRVLIHGRSAEKLGGVKERLSSIGETRVDSYRSDLSKLDEVEALSKAIQSDHQSLDVIINNAGVYKVPTAESRYDIDIRMVVNVLAPYLLTTRLLPLINREGRVVNLSSAAQEPVNLKVLRGEVSVGDEFSAYAQSKLANAMWCRHEARNSNDSRPIFIAINPGSFLATNMVREGFDVAGNDIGIGADILVRASTGEEFAEADGRYFDNDIGDFGPAHPDARNEDRCRKLVDTIAEVLVELGYTV